MNIYRNFKTVACLSLLSHENKMKQWEKNIITKAAKGTEAVFDFERIYMSQPHLSRMVAIKTGTRRMGTVGRKVEMVCGVVECFIPYSTFPHFIHSVVKTHSIQDQVLVFPIYQVKSRTHKKQWKLLPLSSLHWSQDFIQCVNDRGDVKYIFFKTNIPFTCKYD